MLALLACKEFTGDFSNVIALEYTGPATPRLEEGDTLRLTARALDTRGDSLPDVPITWIVLELDTVQVGFTLDSLTGLITAVTPGGPWTIQGNAEGLRTDPGIEVTVTGAPDSLAPTDSTNLTVGVGQPSVALRTTVFDLTTAPGELRSLGGITVHYALVTPAPGAPEAAGVALAVGATVGTDPHRTSATSASTGIAAVLAQRVGETQPDSILVDAVALTARGDTVAGSPIRFGVVFLKN